MTTIDFEDGRELLRQHDIRVVRARIVDSAEDAINFSARRTIDLCVLAAQAETAPSDIEERLRSPDKIRHAYTRLQEHSLAHPGSRILARRILEDGTDVAVEARDDATLGRIVEIRGGTHVAHRLHPLGEDQAEGMLVEFHAKHGIASSEARTYMLAHLLLHVSEIFEDDAIERMTLAQVRVADNSYEVVDVHVVANRPLDLNRRLGRHAHDRKGYLSSSSGKLS